MGLRIGGAGLVVPSGGDPAACTARPAGVPKRQITRMGNKATGGPFAPLVVVVRNVVGDKEFNKIRGKAIALHSQGA